MRTKNIFYLLSIVIFLFISACNDTANRPPTIDNNVTKKDDSILINNLINETIHDTYQETPIIKESKDTNSHKKQSQSKFIFKNLQNKTSTLTVKNDIYTFNDIIQPIVMVNFSSTWCPPCRGEVPHLNRLQKKFKNNLFILTALVHDEITEEKLQQLIVLKKINFFVSSDQKENLKFEEMITRKLGINDNLKLPLMVIFANGKYFTHYEGSMPQEMIESDIEQLIEKKKER